MQQRPLRDTTVVNKPLVLRLARDLGLAIDTGSGTVAEYELKADLKVASFTRKTSRSNSTALDSRAVLDAITGALRESGQLRVFRPERTFDFRFQDSPGRTPAGWYLHETMTATPVVVPVPPSLVDFGAPETLKVWVSDPLDTHEDARFHGDFVGSFVFLVEELADTLTIRNHISGISALRLLMEGVLEDRDITTVDRSRDGWGRDSFEHPVEKLRRAGGQPLREHTIETVYKIAYMTNEQAWVHNGVEARVNDILGYPLYIAE